MIANKYFENVAEFKYVGAKLQFYLLFCMGVKLGLSH
jgi:hypothetical protein